MNIHRHPLSTIAIVATLAACVVLEACSKKDSATPDPGTTGTGAPVPGTGGASVAAAGNGNHAGAPSATAGAGGVGTGGTGTAGSATAGTGGKNDAGAGGTTGGGGGRANHTTCKADLPGPPLVDIALPDKTGFCMDATLVSQGHYQAFLDAKVDASAQSNECASNATFTPQLQTEGNPSVGCIYGAFKLWDPKAHPDWPMICVDYCDAIAYCAWAGKRLCGDLPNQTSEKLPTDADGFYIDQPPHTEITYACSQGGKTAYLYGDTYDPKAASVVPPDVAAMAKNKGMSPPFDQLTGFNSPLPQWEKGCSGPDLCRIRGGVGVDAATSLRCDRIGETGPGLPGPSFRCCTD